MHKGVLYALLAAVLFGASTPLAKAFINHVAPVMLAGLLYLGSGNRGTQYPCALQAKAAP